MYYIEKIIQKAFCLDDLIINFDEIEEIAKKGIRRSAIFLGFGINSALDESFKKYELTEITQIQIVASTVDDKTLAHYKDEFSNWIVACGLREIIETFNIFLDHIYNACLLVKIYKGLYNKEKFPQLSKRFHNTGFQDKLEILRKEFDVFPKNVKEIISIYQARNCLTHRHGVVGKEDLNFNDRFQIKWKGIEFVIKTYSGEIVPTPQVGGVLIKKGEVLSLRFVERVLLFELGKRIVLSPRDLSEICIFMIQSTKEIKMASINFGIKMGIPIKE